MSTRYAVVQSAVCRVPLHIVILEIIRIKVLGFQRSYRASNIHKILLHLFILNQGFISAYGRCAQSVGRSLMFVGQAMPYVSPIVRKFVREQG